MQFFLGNRRPRFIAGLLQIRNLDFAGKVGALLAVPRQINRPLAKGIQVRSAVSLQGFRKIIQGQVLAGL